MRTPPSSHCTELGFFRVSILKSGDNKSSHNGTVYVRIIRLKSLVRHSLMCVCVHEHNFLHVSNEEKEDKYVSMEDRN